jgi:hypothetical protein
VLTVAQRGGIMMSELGEAVAAYERGKLTAEELGERFVRIRVREHSPSFSWDEADPARVLELVVGASEEPRFESAELDLPGLKTVEGIAEVEGNYPS